MKKIKPLNYNLLSTLLNPKELDFATTDEVEVEIDFLGHMRALEAINLGIGIKSQGYNFFVMGPAGIGKRSLIRTILKKYAHTQPPPDDWCYLHNFNSPDKPIAVKLLPGFGYLLKKAMDDFIETAKNSILSVYESDEYRIGMQEINHKFNIEREKRNLNIQKSANQEVTCLYKEKNDEERTLLARLVNILLEPHLRKIKDDFIDYPKILSYLKSVQKDILTHVSDLVIRDETTNILTFDRENNSIVKYQVNLFVNNKNSKGLPVITEDNPTYSNIIAQVENKMQNGTVITDFTLLRPGALHRANGGFLIVDAKKISSEKYVWENLKNALYTGKIVIESIEHLTGSAKSVSLKPKAIPLKIKVVLVGDRNFYYKLSHKDPDFNELFKVAVDFDDAIERNENNIQSYAHLIASLVKKRGLRAFDNTAVAAVIDYSARLAEDITKLSNYISSIDEVIREADYWAKKMKKKIVDADAVKQAIQSKIYRMDRSRDLYYEDIKRDIILIQTEGWAIGQINCLSVIRAGNFSYGHPTRITTKVRPGKGKVIDIQREVKLAGAIHSKSVFILANYLAGHYCQNELFSLTASISFEQIYGMMDGDSASVAEVCAIVSALANVPLKQYIAVTGSINQYGEVQSIGCVNEKIEGFFDVCKAKGLTGKQGVIIPTANIQNLMLRDDIVSAAKEKKFFIYPINTVDEALTLLTDMDAGTLDKEGKFPENSVNFKVAVRLQEFYLRRILKRNKC